MNKDSEYYNHSGYYDPTAGRAIKNAVKDMEPYFPAKRKRRRKRQKNGTGIRKELL